MYPPQSWYQYAEVRGSQTIYVGCGGHTLYSRAGPGGVVLPPVMHDTRAAQRTTPTPCTPPSNCSSGWLIRDEQNDTV